MASVDDLKAGKFTDLPAWVPKKLRKLVSGLLIVDPKRRLNRRTANSLLNEAVAEIYLSDFLVFEDKEEEKVIP